MAERSALHFPPVFAETELMTHSAAGAGGSVLASPFAAQTHSGTTPEVIGTFVGLQIKPCSAVRSPEPHGVGSGSAMAERNQRRSWGITQHIPKDTSSPCKLGYKGGWCQQEIWEVNGSLVTPRVGWSQTTHPLSAKFPWPGLRAARADHHLLSGQRECTSSSLFPIYPTPSSQN